MKMVIIDGFLCLKNTPITKWGDLKNKSVCNYTSLQLAPDTPMVNVRAFDTESMDWSLGHPKITNWVFPNYLPRKIFRNKKEGDILNITINDINFNLTLAQATYLMFNKKTFTDVIYNFEKALVELHK